MEYDIHTILDAVTLSATAWVVFQMRVKLKHTYQAEMDSVTSYYVVRHTSPDTLFKLCLKAGPCLALAILIHPGTSHWWLNKVLWAACVYLEAVSVLPQLRLMQKNKVQISHLVHLLTRTGRGTVCGSLCVCLGPFTFLQLCTLDPPSRTRSSKACEMGCVLDHGWQQFYSPHSRLWTVASVCVAF